MTSRMNCWKTVCTKTNLPTPSEHLNRMRSEGVCLNAFENVLSGNCKIIPNIVQ